MIMKTVQHNVFLILNSVPAATDPELIRPSIPVMTHSLDLKIVARKAKARKCAVEVAGNVQAGCWECPSEGREATQAFISFSVIPPSRSIPQRYTKVCVICPHNSAGMVSFM
jgi:hypothetical protein